MKGCLVALGVLAGLMICVIGHVWLSFYDIYVRYRLTVEVRDIANDCGDCWRCPCCIA
jgi:hypothetical protein